MGARNRYHHGAWKAVCDRCGFEFLNNQLSKEWTGLRTCRGPGTNGCFEQKHPQDYVKGRRDRQSPPWVRPEPPDVFVASIRVWDNATKQWIVDAGGDDTWILATGAWRDDGEWIDGASWRDTSGGL